MTEQYYSDFLVAKPSAIEGIARLLDFGNTLNEYNCSLTAKLADEIALRMDWLAVGNDLKSAMIQYAEEKERK